MKRVFALGGAMLVALLLLSTYGVAQQSYRVPGGTVLIPKSSMNQGPHRAHTNFQIFISDTWHDNSVPPPNAETPASFACVYKLAHQVSGCPINGTTQNPTGGSGVIAIVDAYDNPDAEDDLAAYSTQFGLPDCTKANGCFQQIYATGQQPQNDPGGWSLEEALDIEMAHAFAPNAKIILMEAATNQDADLYFAEDLAGTMVAQMGGGEATNSWGEDEYSTETNDDSHFLVPGVIYVASTGDGGSPGGYPAMSPNIIAAGGTWIQRSNGNFTGEVGWPGSGGGPSQYEARPSWQNPIKSIVGNVRGIPDFSFDASPGSGPAMYDKDGAYFWTQIGGTSVSSPALAGIINAAGHAHKDQTTAQLHKAVYFAAPTHYKQFWRDITSGSNGAYTAGLGWDFVTGIGSVLTYAGK